MTGQESPQPAYDGFPPLLLVTRYALDSSPIPANLIFPPIPLNR